MAAPLELMRPPVVVVTGPTGSGKTPLAIELALRFGGEILNADSMQVYRYLDVGTATPSHAERARVPHHLFDVVPPDVPYSAGRYATEARALASAIHARGKPVFLTGGSGLYIRAFLEGLVEAGGADRELRGTLEREAVEARAGGDPQHLHRRLADLDPEAAARIHPNDTYRLVRALELAARTGLPPSELHRTHRRSSAYRALTLVVDPGREELRSCIDARCRAMLEAGLLQEVRNLRKRGYGPELRPLQAIGYRHLAAVVDGAATLADALEAMQRDTRRFARRQRTWLRGVRDAVWVHPRDRAGITKAVAAFLQPRTAQAPPAGEEKTGLPQ